MENPFEVLSHVTRALEEQGVAYVVVGSFASSMRGLYRATADIDLVADLRPAHVRPLVEALQEKFYIDEQAVRRAVSLRGSFNAIHFDAVFKVDIFVAKDDDFTRQQLARRRAEKITPDAPQEIYVATAEDTILAKLLWYRSGGEVSRTQWSDVLGIVGTQGSELDLEYLREWAGRLEVSDLLERLLEEAGLGRA
jgi:predicted nucleotidyltransferase